MLDNGRLKAKSSPTSARNNHRRICEYDGIYGSVFARSSHTDLENRRFLEHMQLLLHIHIGFVNVTKCKNLAKALLPAWWNNNIDPTPLQLLRIHDGQCSLLRTSLPGCQEMACILGGKHVCTVGPYRAHNL